MPLTTPKQKAKPNHSILNFFKKEAIEKGLFVQSELLPTSPLPGVLNISNDLWEGSTAKRRKISFGNTDSGNPLTVKESSQIAVEQFGISHIKLADENAMLKIGMKIKRKPFLDDSDSEQEEKVERAEEAEEAEGDAEIEANTEANTEESNVPLASVLPTVAQIDNLIRIESEAKADNRVSVSNEPRVVNVKEEVDAESDFEDFAGLADFEDDELIPEEQLVNDQWLEREELIKVDQIDNGHFHDVTDVELLPATTSQSTSACPICNASLQGLTDAAASAHVNQCLDHGCSPPVEGYPRISPKASPTVTPKLSPRDDVIKTEPAEKVLVTSKSFLVPKPGQAEPIITSSSFSRGSSAFSKMMSSHAEDAAWATAAASAQASRGRPSYEKTCPFYKIMPGLSITVDAFRYGAVQGCKAYFLSHFHSDHYIGLTARWCHGPIYCSRVTANLVRQQLGVNSRYVVPIEFEQEIQVADTGGVTVTMIPANHCPGSALFLFEKNMGIGGRARRILHCGDFRACREHLEHPLLRPDVQDAITGKSRQQTIDICYLDTTYLNPKYAFPKQAAVIEACAEFCVRLNSANLSDVTFEQSAGLMKSFLHSKAASTHSGNGSNRSLGKLRLLVVVGTYSIGKERICMGIAKALGSKIYAPPRKQRICAALEDDELSALMIKDPRAAQVHMTPVFEIRADTLDEYRSDYADTFTHVIGFRPTGWTYRPPNSRFLESPPVSTVLHGPNWQNDYTINDLVPQRGSTKQAACYGVPYSEHSSFRELTAFCCALRIVKIVPTVNVGSAKSREKMRTWVDRWDAEKRKNGLFNSKDF